MISRFYCGVKRGIASRKIRFHLCYQSFTKLRERGSVEMFCGKCVNGSEVANIVDSLVDGNSLIFPPTLRRWGLKGPYNNDLKGVLKTCTKTGEYSTHSSNWGEVVRLASECNSDNLCNIDYPLVQKL